MLSPRPFVKPMRNAMPVFASWMHGFLTVFIVLVVALRTVAAPVMVSAPDAGVMTICAGGEVYYVTLDGTPVDTKQTTPEPCPYNGLILSIPVINAHIAAQSTVARSIALPLPEILALKANRFRQNAPRAPPFPV